MKCTRCGASFSKDELRDISELLAIIALYFHLPFPKGVLCYKCSRENEAKGDKV